MKNSTRLAIAIATATIAMSAPATASTIVWSQGGDGDNWGQAITSEFANAISFSGTDTSYGTGLTGPMAHSHGQPMNWSIVLTVNGINQTIFSQFLQNDQTPLISLGTISFGGGNVTGIALTCDNCSFNTYHQFGDATFTLSNAVPEPMSWAMMIAGFGLVGAAARRRRTQGSAPIAA